MQLSWQESLVIYIGRNRSLNQDRCIDATCRDITVYAVTERATILASGSPQSLPHNVQGRVLENGLHNSAARSAL